MPAWPAAGRAVADELDSVCPITIGEDGKEVSSCPAIDAWHDRLGKLKDQLEVTRK